jgi:hypothetical protein
MDIIVKTFIVAYFNGENMLCHISTRPPGYSLSKVTAKDRILYRNAMKSHNE